MFVEGLSTAAGLLFKLSTQDSYTGLLRSWTDFLDLGGATHCRGVLTKDLRGGQTLAKYLVGYMKYLEPRYSVTTFRGRVASVISMQRTSFHVIDALPLVWPLVRGFEARHLPAEKAWLSLADFTHFNRFIWLERNPSERHLVMRWLFGMFTEALYRIGAVLPPNASSKLDHCSFDLTHMSHQPKSKTQDRHFRCRLVEKTARQPNRTVRTLDCGTPYSLDMKNGGVYESALTVRTDLGQTRGRPTIGGGIVTQDHFRKWVNLELLRAGLTFELEGLAINFTPTALRRTAVTHMYRHVGPLKAKFMIGHSSSKTATDFYVGVTEQERFELMGSIPWKSKSTAY